MECTNASGHFSNTCLGQFRGFTGDTIHGFGQPILEPPKPWIPPT